MIHLTNLASKTMALAISLLLQVALCVSVGAVLVACGGGSDSSGPASSPIVPSPALSVLTLLAGQVGGPGNLDGSGAAARFDLLSSIAADASGNVFYIEGQSLRKITPLGLVSTQSTHAELFSTGGIAIDSTGNVFVADTYNYVIRKITPSGVLSTFAGTVGQLGSADGLGANARFNLPQGIAIDGADNLYVADTSNHTIRKVTPAGLVSTLAGVVGASGTEDGTSGVARFRGPISIAADRVGNVYLAGPFGHSIRKINAAGVASTLAGVGDTQGSQDGLGSAARFASPSAIAVDADGNLFVADTFNGTVRRITAAGLVSTLAGSASETGAVDATGTSARFRLPKGIAIDRQGNVIVADTGNSVLRRITPAAEVSTLAGLAPLTGAKDGLGATARFFDPGAIATDAGGTSYLIDSGNSTIRKITPAGLVSTFAGIAGQRGSQDGTGPAARFQGLESIAVDGAGTVYVTEYGSDNLRKISPAGVTSTMDTNAPPLFGGSQRLALDVNGNVFVANSHPYNVRKISPSGAITTLDGGLVPDPLPPRGGFPTGVAMATDAVGNLYVGRGRTIRKITPAGSVSTFVDGAGSDISGPLFNAMTFDLAGNLYTTAGRSSSENTIVKITPQGAMSVVAGSPDLSGVRLSAAPISFAGIGGLSYSAGNLVITTAHGVVVMSAP